MQKSSLKFIIVLVIVLIACPIHASVVDGLVPCVVFLMQEVDEGKEAFIGSGFLVRTDDKAFLITASHVSKTLGEKWLIVMPGQDGKAIKAHANNLIWKESSSADVAVMLLDIKDSERKKSILNRSLPLHLLSARPLPPSRDIPLTVMGYPLGLGSSGYVSPLSLETKAASGFITLPRFDNGQPAKFILLQDPSIGRLSGGPVFDTGMSYFEGGRKITVREGVSVVGIIHGVIFDKTGGKFSAVVPSTDILEVIEDMLKH